MCAGDLGAELLNLAGRRDARGRRWELFVEREPDGLDGDVWGAALLEEGSEDARRDVATTADGDHELRVEVIENLRGGFLTELMDLKTVSGDEGGVKMSYLHCCT